MDMAGFSPMQGHVPAAVPFLGHALEAMRRGEMNSALFVAKGSLFLGRMSQLSDGMSFLLEKNPRGRSKLNAECGMRNIKLITSFRIPNLRGGVKIVFKGKRVIVIGERDGVPGPAIANCVVAAGGQVVYTTTECFV